MRAVIIIPARYSSTRLPAKPLLKETGKYLIQHTFESAGKSKKAAAVIVATDDRRIADAVKEFGGKFVMTSPRHASGTDRIAEAAANVEADVIVNVQGDEPEMPPSHIDALIGLFENDPAVRMATLAVKKNDDGYLNPNIVKVVVDSEGYALYFSRSPLPFYREEKGKREYLKHLGIYGYRKNLLREFASWPRSALEAAECLEQLRALENGVRIRVAIVEGDPTSIDTPEDYKEFCKRCGTKTSIKRA
jgi:3-deoxy-manno-octulosonate cytidylyltransferase (CMP-KDO synthetase)